jgi:hypothetical protein
MLHALSTLVILMLMGGLYVRHRNRILHFKMMLSAFLIDVGLVLYIEISRHAVERVVTHIEPFVWFHAAVSLGVIILYIVQIFIGRRILQGRMVSTHAHRYVGISFCVLRLINYVTSFSVS